MDGSAVRWTAMILAGGSSRRMGRSKALLDVGGQAIVARLALASQEAVGRVVVVSRRDEADAVASALGGNAEVIGDPPEWEGCGPLAGMLAGMRHAEADRCMVLAVDMPFLEAAYLRGLRRYVEASSVDADAFVPEADGRSHPFAGAYRCDPDRLQRLLASGSRSWRAYAAQADVHLLPEAVWSAWTRSADPFFNMNAREDWERAEAVLRQEGAET